MTLTGCIRVSIVLLLSAQLAPAAHADRLDDRSAEWTRTGTDILSGFANMYNPHIVHEPESDYPFKMWFFGWAGADTNPGVPGCDAIFHARGRSLDTWEVYCGDDEWDTEGDIERWRPVLHADDQPWDEWHNGDPSVVRYEGGYLMAYSSTGFDLDRVPEGSPGDTDLDISCIRAAQSPDGLHWTRSERPILLQESELGIAHRPEDPEYTGMFHRPSLMLDGDRLRLWFDYWAPGPRGLCMGHAVCEGDPMDSSSWRITHSLDEPLIEEWPNPDVVKYAGRYFSFADPGGYPGGVGWTSRQLATAVSDDGLTWEILGYIAPDDGVPACHVPEALVVIEDGQESLYLFYACQIGGEPYDYRYDRMRYMRATKTQLGP